MNLYQVEQVHGLDAMEREYKEREQYNSIQNEVAKLDLIMNSLLPFYQKMKMGDEAAWEMYQGIVKRISENPRLLCAAQSSDVTYHIPKEWLADMFEDFGSVTLYATGVMFNRVNGNFLQKLWLAKKNKKEYDSFLEKCVRKLEKFLS